MFWPEGTVSSQNILKMDLFLTNLFLKKWTKNIQQEEPNLDSRISEIWMWAQLAITQKP